MFSHKSVLCHPHQIVDPPHEWARYGCKFLYAASIRLFYLISRLFSLWCTLTIATSAAQFHGQCTQDLIHKKTSAKNLAWRTTVHRNANNAIWMYLYCFLGAKNPFEKEGLFHENFCSEIDTFDLVICGTSMRNSLLGDGKLARNRQTF